MWDTKRGASGAPHTVHRFSHTVPRAAHNPFGTGRTCQAALPRKAQAQTQTDAPDRTRTVRAAWSKQAECEWFSSPLDKTSGVRVGSKAACPQLTTNPQVGRLPGLSAWVYMGKKHSHSATFVQRLKKPLALFAPRPVEGPRGSQSWALVPSGLARFALCRSSPTSQTGQGC